MAKLDFNLNEVRENLFSPGNIFWIQNSGNRVLLSSKNDFINFKLIEKLFTNKYQLIIEDRSDNKFKDDFISYFEKHKSEILVKEKMQWRRKLLTLFSTLQEETAIGQLEIGEMAWKVFSKVENSKAQNLLEIDIDLFKRSLNVATSYTLLAFVLGCYDDNFLSNVFTKTFLDQMELDNTIPVSTLKNQLETKRISDNNDFSDAKKIELTDLEILLTTIDGHYSFKNISNENVFAEIKAMSFVCERKILAMINKSLEAREAARPTEIYA